MTAREAVRAELKAVQAEIRDKQREENRLERALALLESTNPNVGTRKRTGNETRVAVRAGVRKLTGAAARTPEENREAARKARAARVTIDEKGRPSEGWDPANLGRAVNVQSYDKLVAAVHAAPEKQLTTTQVRKMFADTPGFTSGGMTGLRKTAEFLGDLVVIEWPSEHPTHTGRPQFMLMTPDRAKQYEREQRDKTEEEQREQRMADAKAKREAEEASKPKRETVVRPQDQTQVREGRLVLNA